MARSTADMMFLNVIIPPFVFLTLPKVDLFVREGKITVRFLTNIGAIRDGYSF
jgi:hypothetical protein